MGLCVFARKIIARRDAESQRKKKKYFVPLQEKTFAFVADKKRNGSRTRRGNEIKNDIAKKCEKFLYKIMIKEKIIIINL